MQSDKESIKSTGMHFTPAPPVRCSTIQCFYVYKCANRTGLVEKSADFCLIQDNKGSSNGIGKLLKLSFRLHFWCPFEMCVEISSNTNRTNMWQNRSMCILMHTSSQPTQRFSYCRGQHTYVVILLYGERKVVITWKIRSYE